METQSQRIKLVLPVDYFCNRHLLGVGLVLWMQIVNSDPQDMVAPREMNVHAHQSLLCKLYSAMHFKATG